MAPAQDGAGWTWSLYAPGDPTPVLKEWAPSRAIAAALVVRAIARGMTCAKSERSLAA